MAILIRALLLISTMFWAGAQPRYATEHEIKAAVLFNLGQFVDWPPTTFTTPEAPFVIGVLGQQNPFGRALDRMVEGEKIQQRRVLIKYGETLDALGQCHILFVSRSEARRLPFLLQELRGKSILTVSDMGGFAVNGGMVNLVTAGERVRMIVNAAQMETAELRASSKLLRIAEIVKTE